MTAIISASERFGFLVLAAMTLPLFGCSSEPSPSGPTASPEAAQAVTKPTPKQSVAAAVVPWSEQTLADGEFTLEEGFRALT
ncbi:MAG: hypothetical protein FD138_2530, partial [Planctomycetota bacterium]